jgi:hypothetical protein
VDDAAISRLQSLSGIMETAASLRSSQRPSILEIARLREQPWQPPGSRACPVSWRLPRHCVPRNVRLFWRLRGCVSSRGNPPAPVIWTLRGVRQRWTTWQSPGSRACSVSWGLPRHCVPRNVRFFGAASATGDCRVTSFLSTSASFSIASSLEAPRNVRVCGPRPLRTFGHV